MRRRPLVWRWWRRRERRHRRFIKVVVVPEGSVFFAFPIIRIRPSRRLFFLPSSLSGNERRRVRVHPFVSSFVFFFVVFFFFFFVVVVVPALRFASRQKVCEHENKREKGIDSKKDKTVETLNIRTKEKKEEEKSGR